MNSAMRAASIGAAVSFMVMVFIIIFRVHMPLVVHVLWPTRWLQEATRGSGDLWMLFFEVVSFFSNALLYGIVGYGIGKLIEGRRTER
jgi:hypothetical protein